MAVDKKEPYWSAAERASSLCGVAPEILYGQWVFESGHFRTDIAINNNNLGGYRANPGSPSRNGWFLFRSVMDFGEYAGRYIDKYVTKGEKVVSPARYMQLIVESGYLGPEHGYTEVPAYLDCIESVAKGNTNVSPPDTPPHVVEGGYTPAGPYDPLPRFDSPYDAGYTVDPSSIATAAENSQGSGNTETNTTGKSDITTFAKFTASEMFSKFLTQQLRGAGEQSLHQYLLGVMGFFYYNIYYIPTLPFTNCIVVKPETLFVDVPSCNMILPQMIGSGHYQRNEKSEPTRLLMSTPPLTHTFGAAPKQSSANTIQTMVLVDYSGADKAKTVIKGFKAISPGLSPTVPMSLITEYEKDHGVRLIKTTRGADMFVYMKSVEVPDKKDKDDKSGKTKLILKGQLKDFSPILTKLANYVLQRSRYEQRRGSFNIYFNPYIVPGFPGVFVGHPHKDDANFTASISDVTHSLTSDAWVTSVSIDSIHDEIDPSPEQFPIVEEAYVQDLPNTYKRMLGSTVTAIPYDTAVKQTVADAALMEMNLESAYTRVWRPMTTLDETLKKLLNNATMSKEGDFSILKIKALSSKRISSLEFKSIQRRF